MAEMPNVMNEPPHIDDCCWILCIEDLLCFACMLSLGTHYQKL